MKIHAVLAAAALLLAGCSGITDVIQRRDSLYQAAPIHPPTLRPSADAYSKALAVAQSVYGPRLDGSPATVIEAGISAANGNCRALFRAVSQADAQWRAGETNVGVLSALISGALAASGVHRDVLTAWGLGSAAWQGYSQGFVSNVLGLADYDLQTKVREVMSSRAAALRAQAARMSYPEAIDALEDYEMLCTIQSAKALSRSALTAVTTTVAPSGAITVTPAALASAFQKDDSGERIVAWWSPGDTDNKERQAAIRKWLDDRGFPVSITFFANSRLHAEARKQLIADLQIPEAPK